MQEPLQEHGVPFDGQGQGSDGDLHAPLRRLVGQRGRRPVGVANTMIISVLERRHEIGLRRSLGATRGQIRIRFVTESLMPSGLGGIVGVVLGAAATAVYASTAGLP